MMSFSHMHEGIYGSLALKGPPKCTCDLARWQHHRCLHHGLPIFLQPALQQSLLQLSP